MSYNYKIIDGGKQPHFLTFCVVGKIPIFTNCKLCDLVLEDLRYCRNNFDLRIYAYVIMDNHIHLIISSENCLSDIIRRLKSHLAKILINELKFDSRTWIVNLLRELKLNRKKDQIYQFWKENSHSELIQGLKMLNQKIDYIHHNPVRRGLISNPVAWIYSSAEWFETRTGLLEMNDIDVF